MLRRGIARAAALVLLANSVFLALVVLAPGSPESVTARVREAFRTGDLDDSDYLRKNIRRGWHQYNDCNILEMLSNPAQSRIQRALAPLKHHADPEFSVSCPTLRALVLEGATRDTMLSFPYARYWHGYMVPVGLGLRVMELRTLRLGLLVTVMFAILLLGVAALRAGRYVRRAGVVIAGAAGLCWGAPYFAASLCHGPGDAVLVLGLACLAARPRLATSLDTLIPFAGVFGAVVVYFEMMTGQLVIASAWLGALTLAAIRDEKPRAAITGPGAIVAAIAAFAVGGIATVLVKQLLASMLVAPTAGSVFLATLGAYMEAPPARGVLPGVLVPVLDLIRTADLLAYWSRWAGDVLGAALVLAWVAALTRGWRNRATTFGRDVLWLTALALMPVAWVVVLPGMTQMHIGIFARMLVVPIALGPLALLWPASDRSVHVSP